MKKKLIIIVAVILILAVCFAGCHSTANFQLEKSSVEINVGEKAYEYLSVLAGADYKGRKANSEGELKTAQWLRDNLIGREEVRNENDEIIVEGLAGFGYENADKSEYSAQNPGINKFEFKFTDNDGKEQLGTSYNVSATKKAANSKGEIILGAYYDNCYGVEINDKAIIGDGSYESGASVAVLLAVAEQLTNMQGLQYDITIVFFGAGSVGYLGAQEYTSKIDLARKENIKLMINYNQVVGGKNMYMYSRDFGTDYNDYFYEVAKVNDVNATKIPSNKHTANAKLSEDSLQNYFHIGMVGNNYYFMKDKIPTVNFMSFDWSSNKNFYNTEYPKMDNVYQSDKDTIGNLIERSGGVDAVKTKMNDIVKATTLAFTGGYAQGFEKALGTARQQEVNEKAQGSSTASALSITLKVALVVVVIGLTFVARNYMQKNKDKYVINIPNATGEGNVPKQDVFEEFFGGNNGSDANSNNSGGKDNNSNKGGGDVFDGF